MGHSGAISFLAQHVPNTFRDRQRLRTWLMRVAKAHGQRIDELNYVLLSDKALLKYNQDFLQHNDYTDVITFDSSGGAGSGISGDVLMSLDRIKDNARAFGVPVQQELRRVMVHGLLHLLGHTDKSEKQRAVMRAQEDRFLALY